MNSYADDRLRSDKGTNFLGFIDVLRSLWTAAEKPGTIIRRYAKNKEATTPVITYKVKGRRPHPNFKEIKPRLRTTTKHHTRPDEFVELYGIIYQVFVEFKIHSTSDEEADEIVSELDDFIENYKAFFKRQGVKEIFFKEQGEDEFSSEHDTPLATRTLIYDMQFEKVIPKFLNQIEQLAIKANILNTKNNEEES